MAMSVVYTTINGVLYHENRGGVETEYVPDTLGSLIQCRDSSGNVTYTADYWPYGEVRTSTGSKSSPWGFVGLLGYLTDLAKRLYVRARHYRPNVGQWQTVDPLWPDEMAYVYSNSAPNLNVDMTGLECTPDLVSQCSSTCGKGSYSFCWIRRWTTYSPCPPFVTFWEQPMCFCWRNRGGFRRIVIKTPVRPIVRLPWWAGLSCDAICSTICSGAGVLPWLNFVPGPLCDFGCQAACELLKLGQ